MRTVFIATGDIALPTFRHLLIEGPKPLALVTQPDKPVGRKQVLTPPRIKVEAEEAGIPVLQPDMIGDIADDLEQLKPELLLVMAYGQILRNDVLELPNMDIVNLHASLLPKYRGAACIQAAIDAGDEQTGVCAQHMVRKLDAGDLIHSRSLPIEDEDTGGSLHDKLAELAVMVTAETIDFLASGKANRTPQNESLASYIGKLNRDDGRLDWSMTAEAIERRIRAYDPWPGTYASVEEEGGMKRVKIFPPSRIIGDPQDLGPGEIKLTDGRMLVGTGAGVLEIKRLQPEGGRRMNVEEYLRGKAPKQFL